MPSIKEIFDKLPQDSKDVLNYAFEHGLEQYVPTGNSEFIGVNINHIQHLTKTTSAGSWSIGRIEMDAK